MADIVLRMCGPGLEAADALSLVDKRRVIQISRAGEPSGLRKAVAEHPSFNLQIAENEDDPASAIAEARTFLKMKRAELLALAERGASGELDFGIYVDARGSGMKSLRLGPEFLELLSRAGLTLCMTSYIVCDDDDGDDEAGESGGATVLKPLP